MRHWLVITIGILFSVIFISLAYSMEENNAVPDNTYMYEWPPSDSESDVVDSFLNYVSELDPIQQQRAIKRIVAWLKEAVIPVETQPTPIVVITPIITLVPQSIRFSN